MGYGHSTWCLNHKPQHLLRVMNVTKTDVACVWPVREALPDQDPPERAQEDPHGLEAVSVCHLRPGPESPSILKSQMRTRSREKSYACQQCGRAFSEPWSLGKQTHAGTKPYACQECRGAFCRPLPLTVHVISAQGETLAVSQCEKAFRHSSSLTTQRRVHSGREATIALSLRWAPC